MSVTEIVLAVGSLPLNDRGKMFSFDSEALWDRNVSRDSPLPVGTGREHGYRKGFVSLTVGVRWKTLDDRRTTCPFASGSLPSVERSSHSSGRSGSGATTPFGVGVCRTGGGDYLNGVGCGICRLSEKY